MFEDGGTVVVLGCGQRDTSPTWVTAVFWMEFWELWRSCLDRANRFISGRQTGIDQEEWMKLLEDLNLAGRMIDSLALFSTNETIEEVPTRSLPLMSVQFWLGIVSQKAIKTEGKEERRFLLLGCKSCFEEFFGLLKSYQVHSAQATVVGDDDPMSNRTMKIARMKRIRELEESLEERKSILEQSSNDDETKDGCGVGEDEGALRTFYTDQLTLFAMQAEQELSLIRAELDLLSQENRDEPVKPMAVPIRNEVRRVTRPFTLLKSRREQVASGVFRPGHNLPTMTIDEYLDLERQRGGIIESARPSDLDEDLYRDDDDDDDEDEEDEAMRAELIMKDAMRDNVRRGSGNTYNRG